MRGASLTKVVQRRQEGNTGKTYQPGRAGVGVYASRSLHVEVESKDLTPAPRANLPVAFALLGVHLRVSVVNYKSQLSCLVSVGLSLDRGLLMRSHMALSPSLEPWSLDLQ